MGRARAKPGVLRRARGASVAALVALAAANACGRSNLDARECDAADSEPCEVDGKPGVLKCVDGRWSLCSPRSGSGAGSAGSTGVSGGRGPGGGAGKGGNASNPGGNAGRGGLGGLGGLGGEGGDEVGGAAGSLGEAGEAGTAGAAGAGGENAAGAGGQGNVSLFCAASEQAVLYLLTNQGALIRVDADTLEPLSQLQLGISGLNSLAVTTNGTVYVAAGLQVYRANPLTGQAVNVNLDTSGFVGDGSMTIGFSPNNLLVSGAALLVAHADASGDIDLYEAPLTSFDTALLHHFDTLTEYPEPVADENGRLFALLADGFVEYDAVSFASVGVLQVPGLPQAWSGDDAYLSGYLFAVYVDSAASSRLYRAHVMPNLADSPLQDLGTFPAVVIGSGAACESGP